MTHHRHTSIVAVALALLALGTCDPIPVPAMQPKNGVYPTNRDQWSDCCHDQDCRPTPVEVRFEGELAHVRSGLGDFTVPRSRVHQITQPGAKEHVCTTASGFVMCVFYAVGGL